MSWQTRFLRSAPAEHREMLATWPALEDQLNRIWSQAQNAYPALRGDPADFLSFVAAKLTAEEAPHATLDQIHAADLFLAWACGNGDEEAIKLFETHYSGDIRRALSRFGGEQDHQMSDVTQLVREKLFVQTETSPPKIHEYAGRGQLRGWVRLVTLRTAISGLRKTKEKPLGSEIFALLPNAGIDPELQLMKQLGNNAFRAAWRTALKALSVQERRLLQDCYVHNLTVVQIAERHGTSRASASRWVAKARERLLAETRKALREELRLTSPEVDSVVRMIDSQLEVSLGILLEQH